MITEGNFSRAVKYQEYAAAIGQGEVVSRWDMARRFGVVYSTARYNLERAVREGVLQKFVGYASDNQVGWVYALPGTMKQLLEEKNG